MRVSQMRLDEREVPNCAKEIEASSTSALMRTGGKAWLC